MSKADALLEWDPNYDPKKDPDSVHILQKAVSGGFLNQPPPGVEPKVMGRPMKPLNLELIGSFLEVGMSVRRISDYFNVTPQTLYNRCGDLIHAKQVMYDYEILRSQKELADAGDRGMLIHLGKTQLKQSEAPPSMTDSEITEVEFNVVSPPKPVSQEMSDEEDDE